MVPLVRTAISAPAGLVRMRWPVPGCYRCWARCSGGLALAGWLGGQYEQRITPPGPVTVIVGTLVLVWLVRIALCLFRRGANPAGPAGQMIETALPARVNIPDDRLNLFCAECSAHSEQRAAASSPQASPGRARVDVKPFLHQRASHYGRAALQVGHDNEMIALCGSRCPAGTRHRATPCAARGCFPTGGRALLWLCISLRMLVVVATTLGGRLAVKT